MGLFDYVRLDNEKFGEDKGIRVQTKEFDDAWMNNYVVTESGRLVRIETRTEDRSDPTAEPGSIRALVGCMTQIPTGETTDLNFHGMIYLGPYKCKFTDGNLVEALDEDE